MNADDTFAKMLAKYPQAADDPAWPAFINMLGGRAFDGEECLEAWYWFANGFDAGLEVAVETRFAEDEDRTL
jgi:hypothetical protein